jgi:hypothetical protein
LISLVIQAIGGGMAATAVNSTPEGNTGPGTHVMVAGIIFQLASVTIFTVLFGIFFLRVRKRALSAKTKILLVATTISIIMIYIRSIYRTIELLQGWNGYLITHEAFFIVLDGSMMVVCVGIFNIVHPGWFLEKPRDTHERVQSNTGVVLSTMTDLKDQSVQKQSQV